MLKKYVEKPFFEIRNIGRIRSYLGSKAAAMLVHAFVSSKLDYCNSLLYGAPKKHLDKLQRVLNSAARVVCKVSKRSHMTPILKSLHWLPVCERINFKVLLLTFKALNGLAPKYLTELLCEHVPQRALRSGDQHLLTVPRTELKMYGDRCFAKAAPKLWNELPVQIRRTEDLTSFKCELKTFLFRKAYDL